MCLYCNCQLGGGRGYNGKTLHPRPDTGRPWVVVSMELVISCCTRETALHLSFPENSPTPESTTRQRCSRLLSLPPCLQSGAATEPRSLTPGSGREAGFAIDLTAQILNGITARLSLSSPEAFHSMPDDPQSHKHEHKTRQPAYQLSAVARQPSTILRVWISRPSVETTRSQWRSSGTRPQHTARGKLAQKSARTTLKNTFRRLNTSAAPKPLAN